jgi:site-specific recombinase XerD
MLHSIFKRAVRDRVILHNPCADTELPKVPPRKVRILTPEDFERLLAEIPDRFRDLVLTDIETGMRWGELVALRPRHVDFLRRVIAIEETVVEVSKKNSPTGERMVFKAYPKDNEFRTLRVSQDLLDTLAARIASMGLDRDDLLFPSTETKGPIPLSRNTFRTKYWLPALERAGIDFPVRVHDLRHAHASWLLAGGAELKTVMDRLGHAQIQTTQKYLHSMPDADDKASPPSPESGTGRGPEPVEGGSVLARTALGLCLYVLAVAGSPSHALAVPVGSAHPAAKASAPSSWGASKGPPRQRPRMEPMHGTHPDRRPTPWPAPRLRPRASSNRSKDQPGHRADIPMVHSSARPRGPFAGEDQQSATSTVSPPLAIRIASQGSTSSSTRTSMTTWRTALQSSTMPTGIH